MPNNATPLNETFLKLFSTKNINVNVMSLIFYLETENCWCKVMLNKHSWTFQKGQKNNLKP